jgi:filamentous hemagglutinin
MTAGGYKESYCEGYVDQQSGDSSVISAGNNLQITAGSLTNIGSLIAAGNNATISVAGPVVNEAQTLNAYWHSHWVQETGMFSSDKRHDIWACGSAAECTALYGSAYTSVGGTIDPPQPVGNIAATIQAPNLSISSNGVIQNVGNVIGTNVRLTGQSLINGITTANTYTPRVDGPSQVISLSPVNLPGLKLGTTGSGGTGASAVPGQASYMAGVLGGSAATLGPQQLLSELPASLQPSSTLFYYNPEAEDLMLQQAALKQTGQASFIGGLSYDRTNGLSVTDQEKGILYQNALDYAKQNNLQLGVALSQAQINELNKPMLWYVEQTVPDPSCVSTGIVTCKTVTALMPQVYLPSSSSSALSAGGNIIGQDVTLDFNQDGHGSILNTGTISASNTLTVDTGTLTNRANQVDVGHIWQHIKGVGYSDTTGTQVQPGGFMSAANMDLNVQTLSQIGGALQKLNADGTLDQAGTQQFIESLQQKLGAGLTQTTLSDALHTSFTAQGGFGPDSIAAMAFAVVVAVMTYGAASALIGSTIGTAAGSTFAAGTQVATAGLGNIALSAGIAGFASSAASQLTMSGTFNLASAFEAAGVAAITAGLTNGITYSSQGGVGFTTQPLQLGGSTSSLAMLAGVSPAIGTTANQAMGTTATLGTRALAMLAEAGISSTVSTAIEGGSFGNAFKNAFVGELAAAAAYKIGDLANENGSLIPENSPQYILTHALVGCAASAAEGTGCAGGAIGGAVGAFLNPNIDPNGSIPAPLENAFTTIASTLIAGALGANVQGAAMAAQNETQNNYLNHLQTDNLKASLQACAPGDTACVNRTMSDYQSVSGDQQQLARNCDSVTACANVKNDSLSGYGISVSDAQTACQGEAACVNFLTGLGNDAFNAKVSATLRWGDILNSTYVENMRQSLLSSGYSPTTAAVLSAATPQDVAGATESIGGTSGSGGPKVPKNVQPFTNPPQAPVIPSGWVSQPGRTPGSIIFYPPGTDPSAGGSTYIRVMPPGSTPVPGLENGYWTSVVNGQPINPANGSPNATKGDTHIPLPQNSMPPARGSE